MFDGAILDILSIIVCSFILFNTFLLIGIAGLLVKLVQYFNQDDASDRQRWNNIIRERRAMQMLGTNYLDSPKNWDGMPKGKNWDGMPKPE